MCKDLVVGSGLSASTEQHDRDDGERGSQGGEGGDGEPDHEDGADGAGAESRDQDRAGAACGLGDRYADGPPRPGSAAGLLAVGACR